MFSIANFLLFSQISFECYACITCSLYSVPLFSCLYMPEAGAPELLIVLQVLVAGQTVCMVLLSDREKSSAWDLRTTSSPDVRVAYSAS